MQISKNILNLLAGLLFLLGAFILVVVTVGLDGAMG